MSFELFSDGPLHGRSLNLLCFVTTKCNWIHNKNDDRHLKFLVKLFYIMLLVMRQILRWQIWCNGLAHCLRLVFYYVTIIYNTVICINLLPYGWKLATTRSLTFGALFTVFCHFVRFRLSLLPFVEMQNIF